MQMFSVTKDKPPTCFETLKTTLQINESIPHSLYRLQTPQNLLQNHPNPPGPMMDDRQSHH